MAIELGETRSPEDVRGLPRTNFGGTPLQFDHMIGSSMSQSWETIRVLGNTVLAEYVDETENGEIMRDGIFVKQDISHKVWRVARVLQLGSKCTENISVGDLIRFPNDRGIPMVSATGKKLIYMAEERIFDVVRDPTGKIQ